MFGSNERDKAGCRERERRNEKVFRKTGNNFKLCPPLMPETPVLNLPSDLPHTDQGHSPLCQDSLTDATDSRLPDIDVSVP